MISGLDCWRLLSSKKQPCLDWWRASMRAGIPSIFLPQFECLSLNISKRMKCQNPAAVKGGSEYRDIVARNARCPYNSGRSKDHDGDDRDSGQQTKQHCCLLPGAILARIIVVKVAECCHRSAPCARIPAAQGQPHCGSEVAQASVVSDLVDAGALLLL